MSNYKTKMSLLNEPAKITRRRRTADEAGIERPNFDTPSSRRAKIQRPNADGRSKETSKPTPVRISVKQQKSINAYRSDHPIDSSNSAAANDWPMSDKERSHANQNNRRPDGQKNLGFPLVYDISESVGDHEDDQIMDCDIFKNHFQNTNDHFEAISKHMRQSLATQRDSAYYRGSLVDLNGIRMAMTAFSKLSVSERSKLGPAGKSKKRPVYLLIIFATFDGDHHLKCDAYITCVNGISVDDRTQHTFGVNWIMSRLLEMFQRQQTGLNGNRPCMMACCLVEAFNHNGPQSIFDAYWRHVNNTQESSSLDIFYRIAVQCGLWDPECVPHFPNVAIPMTADRPSTSITYHKSMLQFDSSTQMTDRLHENLALVAMLSRAACWLIKEFNRLDEPQLMPKSHDHRSIR